MPWAWHLLPQLFGPEDDEALFSEGVRPKEEDISAYAYQGVHVWSALSPACPPTPPSCLPRACPNTATLCFHTFGLFF